jgi:hypothetical protein
MFSSSKAVTAIALATVAQRGLLDYSARVADYWPDFAHNQKGELRQGDNLPASLERSFSPYFKLLRSQEIDSGSDFGSCFGSGNAGLRLERVARKTHTFFVKLRRY